MKILHLSDTHGKHHSMQNLPEADMLIHSGDVSRRGADYEIEDFIEWFTKQDYKYKIFIAGNHDFYFQRETRSSIQRILPENVQYLCGSGVTIEGINIWGSPVTPTFFNLAFNKNRGKEIAKHWSRIHNDTDILITHGPSFGILDQTKRGLNVGCEDLLDRVNSIKPKYHLFGHIHEAYGIHETSHTTFVNGSVLNESYELVNQPIVIKI